MARLPETVGVSKIELAEIRDHRAPRCGHGRRPPRILQTAVRLVATDLEKQKPTLPIIRALELATGSDREKLVGLLNGDDRRSESLAPYLRRYEAIPYTRHRAIGFAHRARRRLDCLPPSSSRDVLAAMTEFVVSRSM